MFIKRTDQLPPAPMGRSFAEFGYGAEGPLRPVVFGESNMQSSEQYIMDLHRTIEDQRTEINRLHVALHKAREAIREVIDD